MADPIETCKSEVVRLIERQLAKGRIEGVAFNPCVQCDDYSVLANRISVSATHLSFFRDGVRWRSYAAGAGAKARK